MHRPLEQMHHNWTSSESGSSKRDSRNRTCDSNRNCSRNRKHSGRHHPGGISISMVKSNTWLLLLAMLCLINFVAKADETARNGRIGRHLSTTPLTATELPATATTTESVTELTTEQPAADSATELAQEEWQPVLNATQLPLRKRMSEGAAGSDSVLLRLARRFASGNELWDGIIRDCYLRPDISCFQKNVFSYLNEALDVQDVNVTQRLKFFKNQVQYEADKQEQEQQQQQHNANEIPNRARAANPAETPIEEVTTALYGKSIKFAMTHDLEVDLPEVMFNGATFRISPRAIEGNGIIAKLELIPKQVVKARLAGMIIQKKIQKFLRSKIVLSFLALLLIIKIIKIKLFWLLPIVIGVGAAKKLLLKFLLFLFPALSHLFKLCSHYQQSYHAPLKYHHHHHLIDHHHTVVPPWHSGEHQSVPDIIYTHPPKGHPSAYLHGAPVHETHGPGGFEHFEGAWENSGPGLGSDSRPAYTQSHPVYVAGQQQLGPGQGQGLGPGAGLTAAAQIAAQYEPARNNQQQQQQHQLEPQLSPELAAQLKEAIRIQAEQRLIQQQQKILEHQPFVQDGQPLYPLNYDPFYSPILLKIDKIVEQLGVKNDLCKERIVCSMYKDPATYSPHSNFVSAELSRDTSELEPVTHANEAVRRFYRLIQAARDGQDQKDCQSLYPQCTMPAK
ncbi:uncharacterized protein LOC117898051 isoform X2 [Drosophila subobscura]|uniref:uncharacterized protein LOC117898051 isoform X2 n=1 Tax=Drosophila subobscura TaxID=7241 RepID=UPI00155AEA3D|nr:uncharacterized protein LOC117898051 isoform X2 [Drosophila subobscura]